MMSSSKYIHPIFVFSLLFLFLVNFASASMKNDTNNATKPISQDNFENGVNSYWYRAMNNLPYSGNPSTNYSVSPTQCLSLRAAQLRFGS